MPSSPHAWPTYGRLHASHSGIHLVGALTGLSYTAVVTACAMPDLSFHSRSAFCAISDTSAAIRPSCVLPFRAARRRGSNPHSLEQDGFAFPRNLRVRVAQSPGRKPRNGVEGGIAAPSAPLLAAPAQLRACGFRSLISIGVEIMGRPALCVSDKQGVAPPLTGSNWQQHPSLASPGLWV